MAYRSIFQDAIDEIDRIVKDEEDPTGLWGKPRMASHGVPASPTFKLQAWEPDANRMQPDAGAQTRLPPGGTLGRWSGPGGQAFARSLPVPDAPSSTMVPWKRDAKPSQTSLATASPMVSLLSPYYRDQLTPAGGLNGLGYRVEPGDPALLARLLFAEAAGVPDAYDDIAWSTINRVGGSRRGTTLRDIVYEPKQYSSVWETSDRALWKLAGNPASLDGANAMAYRRAMERATGILAGKVPNDSMGATFFFAGDADKPPHWMKDDYGAGKRFRLVKSIGPKHFVIDTKPR